MFLFPSKNSQNVPSVPWKSRTSNYQQTHIDPELGQLIQDRNALPNYFLNTEQNKSLYMNATLSFVHYPKGGGTTIKDCLNTIALKGAISKPALVFARNAADTKMQILNGELGKKKVFMGTRGFSICEYLQSDRCAYFTILRDPYERMVSHYYFCKDGGDSKANCNQPISEFALEVKSLFVRQLTRGHECLKSDGSLWSCKEKRGVSFNSVVRGNHSKFQTIVHYLERKLEDVFAVVGILEEFDVSLGLLQEAFGLPFYDECIMQHSNYKINKTSKRTLERIAAKRLLMGNVQVRNALQGDITLYRKAKEIFEKQKTSSKLKLWAN